MAIEFFCPGCGKLMRTPDQTAGRKGRCPHCSTKVQIPLASIAPNSTPPADSVASPQTPQQATTTTRPQPAPTPKPAQGAPIQFVCANCQKTLRVPAANAGKKGKCPQCNAVMSIPKASAASQPAGAAAAKWKGTPKPAAQATQPVQSAPIQFTCPSCQKSVRVKAAAAGRQGQCPHCKTVVKIPLTSTVTPSPAATPGLTPLDSSGGLTPLGNTGGLTPLGGGGLTPLDSGGLTPLGNTGGLTPLGADPLGAPDPFGGLTELSAPGGFATQDPFGGAASYQAPSSFPAAQTNPYASPTAASSYGSRSKSKSRGRRSGLPWDNKDRHDAPFTETIKMVLFSPVKAFSVMRHSGGDAHPVLFCVFGNLIGGAFAIAYRLLFDIIFTMPLLLSGEGGEVGASVVGMLIGFVVGVVIGLLGLVIVSVVGSYIKAGMFHLCLMMVGGANHGFETTARVVQYTMGATALCAVIPCVGALVQFVSDIVILCIGIANAHETSGVKATCAVLIPYLVCLASCVGLAFMTFSMIISAIREANGG